MTTHRTRWPGTLPWGRWCASLLLPLLLLFAQHGALLHDLSHLSVSETSGESGLPQPHSGSCELCFAFADVDAAPNCEAMGIEPTGLGFAVPPASRWSVWSAQAPPPQSRGPPDFL